MNFHWGSGSPGVSHLSRMSINMMMPPKMAIQTIQVRGGTRNSPPFLGFLSSSFDLLSSGILVTVAAKLSLITGCRNARFALPAAAYFLQEMTQRPVHEYLSSS